MGVKICQCTCILALYTVRDYMWCHRLNDDARSATPAWSKPQLDWIKCNIDCALFEDDGKFVVGISFRDSLGHLIQAHCMVFPFVTTTVECEATTLQHGLRVTFDFGLSRVVFEIGC